jgi:hypothetical protein
MLFASRKMCQGYGQKGTETWRGGRPDTFSGGILSRPQEDLGKKRMHAQEVYDMGLGR